MKTLLLVGLGGGLGAVARHMVSRVALHWPNAGFPLATFTVNVIGGCAMGLLVGWMAFQVDGGRDLRLFFGVGLLGGFTTFSAFSLEMLQMIERKAWGSATLYGAGSVMFSVLALMLGLFLAKRMFAG
ncbi:Fluoride ion transporter CrcB [hydrothermal vent metagenome]|uniref:Fluoride ion transporter CrcB n=1 Tax=hydrothermal vent metagenome TaxID=652676 RepID=A0A3B0RE44_9ZZZZ